MHVYVYVYVYVYVSVYAWSLWALKSIEGLFFPTKKNLGD
jgi:hypothetical protein